ncbi:hypothetical protein D3C86_1581170 [compost metagenome]
MSRYVEFDRRNLEVFSIELAHLLFAAASEVDVVAKQLCQVVAPAARRGNIDEYKAALLPVLPGLPTDGIVVPRYGLSFKPWDSWAAPGPGINPNWWRSYNNVKHERSDYFHEATLQHALNALGALLILIYHLYARTVGPTGAVLPPKDTTNEMEPQSILLRLDGDYYYDHLVV